MLIIVISVLLTNNINFHVTGRSVLRVGYSKIHVFLIIFIDGTESEYHKNNNKLEYESVSIVIEVH